MIRTLAYTMLSLAGGLLFGCSEKSTVSKDAPSSAKVVTYASQGTMKTIDGAPQLTEAMLSAFEQKHKCKFPPDYREFLLKQNGGFPTPDCVEFTEDNRTTHSDVFCFHCIGDERPWASLAWNLEVYGHRLPKDTLPIAHDSCGNLWLLNIGDSQGVVIFWDHGSFDSFDETDFKVWPQVAKSFQEFVDNLHTFEPSPDEEKLVSRYAMVQQAITGMAKSDPAFNKHTLVEGAWDCDIRDGEVKLMCVEYAVHAAATHTDGYSQLRAQVGLIPAGEFRLPE